MCKRKLQGHPYELERILCHARCAPLPLSPSAGPLYKYCFSPEMETLQTIDYNGGKCRPPPPFKLALSQPRLVVGALLGLCGLCFVPLTSWSFCCARLARRQAREDPQRGRHLAHARRSQAVLSQAAEAQAVATSQAACHVGEAAMPATWRAEPQPDLQRISDDSDDYLRSRGGGGGGGGAGVHGSEDASFCLVGGDHEQLLDSADLQSSQLAHSPVLGQRSRSRVSSRVFPPYPRLLSGLSTEQEELAFSLVPLIVTPSPWHRRR